MSSLRQAVVARAESQLGVRYWTMHQGPRGSASEGFGCAMLVCWCLNQVLGTDYYGSCWNLWGDAIGAPLYNQGGGEFEAIDAKDAQPGDVVLYFKRDVNLGYSTAASHAALYVGDGQVIGAYGYGTPGTSYYMAGGSVRRTSVGSQGLGGAVRYIRCKRLARAEATIPRTDAAPTTGGVFPVKRTVTVKAETLHVRSAPTTKASSLVRGVAYRRGDQVNIDGVAFGDGYVWGHYVGASSGKDRYVALGTAELAL